MNCQNYSTKVYTTQVLVGVFLDLDKLMEFEA